MFTDVIYGPKAHSLDKLREVTDLLKSSQASAIIIIMFASTNGEWLLCGMDMRIRMHYYSAKLVGVASR